MIKSLWASVQGDPVFMRRVNGWLTIFWIMMIPVSIVDWVGKQRRLRVGAVAVGARVGALVGVAGRARRGQPSRGTQKRQHQDIAGEVVEKIVAETDVRPVPAAP